MEQRRLRLGDILDDYCPRERRVTNHAVVAMVEEDVKQTRCTTCDAEHAYKGGKEPKRRRKESTSVLYQEVLAGMPESADVVSAAPASAAPVPPPPDEPIDASPDEEPAGTSMADTTADETGATADEGPFHRRLIRATLPRPEGQKEVRQIPEFTIRHNGQRNGSRPFRARGPAPGGNGNRPQGGGRRFGQTGGGAQGGGRQERSSFFGGNPQRQPQPGRNRKRSR